MIDPEKQSKEIVAGSHLPALTACFACTNGPILELGIGHFSTTVLHSLCCPHRRRLVSLENKAEWREWFKPWERDGHEIMDNTPQIIREIATEHWGVVLIDDSTSESRYLDVQAFLNTADYILVHDAEGPEVIKPILPVIVDAKQFVHKRYFPWTLVVSKNLEIPYIP